MYLEEEAIDYFRRYDILTDFLFHILSRHQGEIASRKIGRNMEFEEYREYNYGDNLRDIDWKVYARTDRLYIKKYGSDVNFKLRVVLDNSLSMQYPKTGQSKLEIAKKIVATLYYLLSAQKNHCRLSSINEYYENYDTITIEGLEHILASIQAYGKTDISKIPKHSDEVVFLISDGWWKKDRLEEQLHSLAENRVHFLHILSGEELDFSISGNFEFVDLESGQRVDAVASEIRLEYQSRMRERISNIRKFFMDNELLYEVFPLSRQYYVNLKNFLDTARRLRR